MPAARIIINAPSLLDNWPDIAPGKPRRSALAREDLVHRLLQYVDIAGTAVTLVFEAEAAADLDELSFGSDLDVIFARPGQTPEQVVERLAARLAPSGEVIVVTDNIAEQDSVVAAGARVLTGFQFTQMIANVLTNLHHDLELYNEAERAKFQRVP